MRKTVPFLVIAALTLGCRHGRLYNAEHLKNPCPGGGNSHEPPIVCVGQGVDKVSQNPMKLSLHDHPGRTIGHFFASDGTSKVTVTCDDDPVTYIGNGTPHVIVLPKKTGTFHYTVTAGLMKSDPEMQIDP